MLSTTICPPMSRTSWSEMAIPRPVPPKRRVVLASSCSKGRKMRLMNSGSMPMPVSWTRSIRSSVPSRWSIWRKVTVTSPWLVNFTALERKLMYTWPIRSSSPTTQSAVMPSNRTSPRTSLASRVLENISQSLLPKARRLKGAASSSTLPASMRDIPRMSLMRLRRSSLSSSARSTYCTAGWSGLNLLRMRVSIPVMPFMGVRISWDTRKRKLVLN